MLEVIFLYLGYRDVMFFARDSAHGLELRAVCFPVTILLQTLFKIPRQFARRHFSIVFGPESRFISSWLNVASACLICLWLGGGSG